MSIEITYRNGGLDGVSFHNAMDTVLRNHMDFIDHRGKPSGYITVDFIDEDGQLIRVFLQGAAVDYFASQVASIAGEAVLEQSP